MKAPASNQTRRISFQAGPQSVTATVRRPLIDVWAACALLGQDEDAVLRLVQCGKIKWAFDLKSANARKACLRILAASVVEYGGPAGALEVPNNWQAVLQLIHPGEGRTVSSAKIARQWNCSTTHIGTLIRDGALRVLPIERTARQAFHVERASLARFLEERRFA